MGAPQTETKFPWVGLLTLSALIFTSVTSEFLPTGLLPEIAADLKVTESQVGLLITVFAGTVVLSAAPLAALTRKRSRKSLIIVVLLVFVVSNLLAALAPSYAFLVVARVLGGLAHGLFWAVVGAYAAHLVPKHQIGRAVAITSGGGTAAFVLGVPLGTALGHAFGWRLAFAALAVIIVVLTVLVIRYLPPVDHRVQLKTGEIAVPMNRDRSLPGVVVLCIVIIVIMMGHYIFYTYIAPWLIQEVGFEESAVAPLLFLFGGAGAIGLALAGLVADRFPRYGFVATSAVAVVPVLVFVFFPHSPVIVIVALVVWGIAFGGLPAMLQTRMLHTASARLRDLAAALFTTSFNLAIGTGALVGGLILDRSGFGALPVADLIFLVVALIFSLVSDAWLRSRHQRH